MMQNWTMHYEEEDIKFVGYQNLLREEKFKKEVEQTNTLNFSTLSLRIFFYSTGCPLLKWFLSIQISKSTQYFENWKTVLYSN